jgi:hypothetical protein
LENFVEKIREMKTLLCGRERMMAEKLVDQRQHVLAGFVQQLGVVLLLGGQGAVEQMLGNAQKTRQWGA